MTLARFASDERAIRARRIADNVWRKAAVLFFLLALTIPVSMLMGFRYIGSASVPKGLWFIHQASLQRGVYAFFCLPADVARLGRRAGYLTAGICPGNALPLMKHVVALPGDRVELTSNGVRVDGTLLPQSVPRLLDSNGHSIAGRFVKHRTIVPTGMIWVLGDSSRSWDSRYFGAVSAARVLGIGTPVITSPADP